MPAQVGYRVAGPVAWLTLDSPHNRNALSRALVTGVMNRLTAAASDPAVRVVVVRAEGPTFCSGADLTEASGEGMVGGARRIVALQRALVGLPKPVLVRVHGAVRAGGVGLVAAGDVAVSADDATYALTEVRLGLAAAAISLTLRHRLTPRAVSWAVLSGEVFRGPEAAAAGLVTRSVPAADLDAAVEAAAASLAQGDPQGLRESKRLLNADLLAALDAEGPALASRSADLFASDAARSAMRAFLDRRR